MLRTSESYMQLYTLHAPKLHSQKTILPWPSTAAAPWWVGSRTQTILENTDNTKDKDRFIRHSGGHLNFFAAGSQPTWFTARNDLGNSAGVEDTGPNHPDAQATMPLATYDSGVIVGAYVDQNGSHGFIYAVILLALVYL